VATEMPFCAGVSDHVATEMPFCAGVSDHVATEMPSVQVYHTTWQLNFTLCRCIRTGGK